jgi:hypothetical protein
VLILVIAVFEVKKSVKYFNSKTKNDQKMCIKTCFTLNYMYVCTEFEKPAGVVLKNLCQALFLDYIFTIRQSL